MTGDAIPGSQGRSIPGMCWQIAGNLALGHVPRTVRVEDNRVRLRNLVNDQLIHTLTYLAHHDTVYGLAFDCTDIHHL